MRTIELLEARRLLSTTAGNLDIQFGNHLGVELPAQENISASRVVVQSDGHIVVVGSSLDVNGGAYVELWRLNPDGSFDPTFGSAGIVHSAPVKNVQSENVVAISIDAENRIIIAGALVGSQNTNAGTFVERFWPDGLPDATFGNAGCIIMQTTNFNFNTQNPILLSIDSQEEITLAGNESDDSDVPGTPMFVRVTGAGEMDASFGAGGVKTVADSNWQMVGVKRENDGSLTAICNTKSRSIGLLSIRNDGTTASRTLAIPAAAGSDNEATESATLSDGQTGVLVHHFDDPIRGDWWSLSMLDSHDKFEPSFGEAGNVTVDWPGVGVYLPGLMVEPDGSLVIDLGHALAAKGSVHAFETIRTSLVSTSGPATTLHVFPSQGQVDVAAAVAPDGDVVIACIDVVTRLQPSTNQTDWSFGKYGTAYLSTGWMKGFFSVVTQQPDGKILAGGTTPDFNTLIARFNADGSPDVTFGNGGSIVTDTGGDIENLIVQHNGQIIVATNDQVVSLFPNGRRHAVIAKRSLNGITTGTATDLVAAPDGSLFGVSGPNVFVAPAAGGHRPSYYLKNFTVPDQLDNLQLQTIQVLEDGRLLVGGRAVPKGQKHDATASWPVVMEITSDGRLLRSFDRDGIAVITSLGSDQNLAADQLALRPDGSIDVLVRSSTGNGGLAQLTAAGAVDSSFGDLPGGGTSINFGSANVTPINFNSMAGLILNDDGTLLVSNVEQPNSRGIMAVARYDASGHLDQSFGDNGFSSGGYSTALAGMLRLTSGDVVVVGAAAGVPVIEKIFAQTTYDPLS